jgi:putative DNA primase/helicase
MSSEDNNNTINNIKEEEEKEEEQDQQQQQEENKKSLKDIADILNGEKKDPEYARIAQEEAAAAEEEERQRRLEEEDEQRQLEEQKQQQKKQQEGGSRGVGRGGRGRRDNDDDEDDEEEEDIVKQAVRILKASYNFVTIEGTKEIFYYKDGVYVAGGGSLIESKSEHLFGLDLTNAKVTEIKGHIMRDTQRSPKDFDADPYIINLKNGLFDLRSWQFKEHTPSYISINQKPITYNPKAKPIHFGKYLKDTLYPNEIRTAVELMTFTFYHKNPHEYYFILLGVGANGKSVFTGLLSALHGYENISSVPLSALQENRFAASDLEGKNVNIDTELSSATIKDLGMIKRLTGSQPVRIERKNQQAYDTKIYAKLLFNANKIPETKDTTDAHFRREIIISFPNQFQGKKADIFLLDKLSSEEELSGIFNALLLALRRIVTLSAGQIYTVPKTIEERRHKHELVSDPIAAFIKAAISSESTDSDYVTKDDMYNAYLKFCKYHNLPVEQKITLGRILRKRNFNDGKEATGERRTYWKSVKLAEWLSIDAKQETLI